MSTIPVAQVSLEYCKAAEVEFEAHNPHKQCLCPPKP